MVGGAGAAGRGIYAANNQGGACGVGAGEDCTACGVSCSGGGAGSGAMSYVGVGQGQYSQETTYKYVGCGGDFDAVRPRRDFTCLITTCCLLSLLLLIPLLLWLLSGTISTGLYDCESGFMNWESAWSPAQQEYCCTTMGRGCTTTQPATFEPVPTQPPTPPPTMPPTPPPTPPPTAPRPIAPPAPSGPVDPFNCAVDPENTWKADKQAWCCRIHHRGCPQPIAPPVPLPMPVPMPVLPQPAPPADPYNCADGFSNWQAGWSVGKKEWCCRVHGKGCPNSGGGCAPVGTTSPPYDCNAGFANWQQGWSVAKKAWCCTNAGKGCQTAVGGCA